MIEAPIKFVSFSHATCEPPGESSRMSSLKFGSASGGWAQQVTLAKACQLPMGQRIINPYYPGKNCDPGISALGVATCWRTGRR